MAFSTEIHRQKFYRAFHGILLSLKLILQSNPGRMRVLLMLLMGFGMLNCGDCQELSRLSQRLVDQEDTFHQILTRLGFDPRERIATRILPEAVQLAHNAMGQLSECYDARVGAQEVNIFNETLHSIVWKYFVRIFED